MPVPCLPIRIHSSRHSEEALTHCCDWTANLRGQVRSSVELQVIETPNVQFTRARNRERPIATYHFLHTFIGEILYESWGTHLWFQGVDAELAKIVSPCHIDMLETGEVGGVMCTTGNLCHIVPRGHVSYFSPHWSVLFEGYIACAKLAILTFTTSVDVPIRGQKAWVLETTVDLNDLVFGI